VLTGLIGALIGQGLDPFDAAILGVWAHGRAGDLAAEHLGQTALIATDLLVYLPAALREAGG
jgi:NAD(P)H-hydrate epimerase